MAYETGTASSMHDLLDKIRVFLTTNGWTQDSWVDDSQMYETWTGLTATGSKRLHVHKTAAGGPTMYFNFRSATRLILFHNHDTVGTINGRYDGETRGIGLNGSTGYNGANNWDEQPGGPVNGTGTYGVGACMTEIPNSGSFNYWIFQNGDCTNVVVEIASGIFMHMAFGCLVKGGTYTGGQFYSASLDSYDPSFSYLYLYGGPTTSFDRTQFLAYNVGYSGAGAVYFTADSDTDWRHSGAEGDANTGKAYYLNVGGQMPYINPAPDTSIDTHCFHLGNFVLARAPNTFNGLAPMSPVHIFTKRASTRWSYLGYPEGIRVINCTNYTPGEEVTIGADIWKVFPAHTKTNYDAVTNFYGDRVGFAFKKVV